MFHNKRSKGIIFNPKASKNPLTLLRKQKSYPNNYNLDFSETEDK